jgi:heme A synthase
VVVVAQLLLGVLNFVLQAPVVMQLVHLLVADLVWVAFVLLGASALAAGATQVGDEGEVLPARV